VVTSSMKICGEAAAPGDQDWTRGRRGGKKASGMASGDRNKVWGKVVAQQRLVQFIAVDGGDEGGRRRRPRGGKGRGAGGTNTHYGSRRGASGR
jgi:hypothetical protein